MADLAGKVTQAWRDFAEAFGTALAELPAEAEIYLTVDPTAYGTGEAVYSIAANAVEGGSLLALAVGNLLLPEGYRLDRAAVAAMIELGWSPPGVIAGSGEHFGRSVEVAAAPQLAAVITRTLRDVYGAPHPAFVVYAARDAADQPVTIPQLGTARHESALVQPDPAMLLEAASDDGTDLPEQVKTVVAAMLKTTPDELPVDKDGDIGIRAGSAMVFVRVRENPPLVDVFSPLLTEVDPTEDLFAKLSELTNRMPIGRLYLTGGTVWASIPVMGRKFQPTHLMLAVQVMTGLADELDDRLHGEFGGKRFFSDGDKPVLQESERTGMYL
ncbi:YbjN domain-containing protein [Allocatelliglobosispora scoriae]|nr:YbjN domain-containing protein [Allocatelliglobosispora scoriae]